MSRTVVVMAKAPAPGEVKTRLCPPLTAVEAAELHRCFVLDTLGRFSPSPSLELAVAYAPAQAESFFRKVAPAGARLVEQSGHDIGERMSRCFETLCAPGRSVVMVGADSPTLPPGLVEDALVSLERNASDVVLGPAEDGGYYLIGMTSAHSTLFRGVEWSSDSVLRSTLSRAERLGLRTHLLQPCYDVDTPADLARLVAELTNSEEARRLAPRTADCVEALRARVV